jgi:hypothetical protein
MFRDPQKTSLRKYIFLGPCGAKKPGNITAKRFQSTKYITTPFIGSTKREENC